MVEVRGWMVDIGLFSEAVQPYNKDHTSDI